MKFWIFFLTLFVSTGLRAQSINVDSLYTSWQDVSKDTVATMVHNLCLQAFNSGNNSEVQDILKESKIYFDEIGEQQFFIKNVLRQVGWTAYLQGYANESSKMYEEALAWGYAQNDTLIVSFASRVLGTIYEETLKDYNKALEFYKIDFQYSSKGFNLFDRAFSNLNLGTIYLYKGQYELAKKKLLKGDSIAGNNNLIRPRAFAHMRLAKMSELLGDKVNAVTLYKQSIAFVNQIPEKETLPELYVSLGKLFNERNEFKNAIENCKSGYEAAKKQNNLEWQKLSCECLYHAYDKIDMDVMAYQNLRKLHEIDIELDLRNTIKKLQLHKFKNIMFQDSLKEVEELLKMEMTHKEEVMNKDMTRNILFGSGLILLLLAIGLFSRWRHIKKSHDILSKEKDRSEKLLLNILPAEIAEELKSKGSADARDFDQASILFTDFKEFTQVSKKLSAKDLVAEINHCFKAFDGICGKYNIEKIKTIGDSYMAAGGIPVPNVESVKNTILAALEMAEFIVNRKIERESVGQIPFEMRTGIHTGTVVAGIVGVKKFQYDVWGDTVNTASRMESRGEVGQVNISQSTYDLLINDPDFVFESRGKIQAKGKGKIEMYFVKRA
jgi:adenylate cyclase